MISPCSMLLTIICAARPRSRGRRESATIVSRSRTPLRVCTCAPQCCSNYRCPFFLMSPTTSGCNCPAASTRSHQFALSIYPARPNSCSRTYRVCATTCDPPCQTKFRTCPTHYQIRVDHLLSHPHNRGSRTQLPCLSQDKYPPRHPTKCKKCHKEELNRHSRRYPSLHVDEIRQKFPRPQE